MGCSKCRYSPRGCSRCVNNFTKVNGARADGAPTPTFEPRGWVQNSNHVVRKAKTPTTATKEQRKESKIDGKKSIAEKSKRGRPSLSDSIGVKTPKILTERVENGPTPAREATELQEENGHKKRSRVQALENGNDENDIDEDLSPSSQGRVLFEEDDVPSPTPLGAMSPGASAAMLAQVISRSPSSLILGGAIADLPHSPLAAAFAMVNDMLDSPRPLRRELTQGVGGSSVGWDF